MHKRRLLIVTPLTDAFERQVVSAAVHRLAGHRDWTWTKAALDNGANLLKDLRPDAVLCRSREWMKGRRPCAVPLVQYGWDPWQPPPTAVAPDNDIVGQMAAAHFAERAFRDVGVYDMGKAYARRRTAAFAKATTAAGMTCHSFTAECSGAESQTYSRRLASLASWLDNLPKPVGIFAPTDDVADRIVQTCEQKNLSVPHEVSVLGTGNDPLLCSLVNPNLSSIDLNGCRVGATAVDTLVQWVERSVPPHNPTLVPPNGPVTRTSTDVLAIPDPHVSDALRFIRQNAFDQGFSVTDIARRSGLSRRSLERRFTRLVGYGPAQEILRARLIRAAQLAADTNMTIGRIAEECGFPSASNLAQRFREHFQTTPQAYRHRHQPLVRTG